MTTKHEIRDSGYRRLGYIEIESNGKQTLYDSGSSRLGYYDPRDDKTYKIGGVFVSYGNTLAMMLK